MKELQNFLNKSFKGSKIKNLANLTSPLKHGQMIPKGTLVIMASGDARLRLKILENDTPHKGFSTPLVLNSEAINLNISPNYLHWYFSHKVIQEQLMRQATGSVFLRIPKNIIDSIPIPIPTHSLNKQSTEEVILIKRKDDDFRELMNSFYKDYLLSIRNERFRIAIIIAGAMCESIIYRLLLDEGVDNQILDNDHSLGLGKLLTYLRLLKLDKALNLPMPYFAEVQKKRNLAVHIGTSGNKLTRFTTDDLVGFDHIIKYFGI